MVAVDIAKAITKESIEETTALWDLYSICTKKFKDTKKLRTTEVCDFLHGVVCAAVEKSKNEGIYTDWTHEKFIDVLNGVFRHTMQNLDSSDALAEQFFNKKYDFKSVAQISPFIKNEQVWKEIKMILQLREEEGNVKLIKHSDKKCFKCGKHEIFSFSKQTRSADEPETHFFTCLNCNNKWKI